ncbi:hypothetical protein [Maritalea mediterranea]|uniref:Uncharacterized protein n=1 Tax=Maritalea mediterranea TaxID=2909667 RepID=A0ABS9E763_9HYPH|nr:hypothetical protein [Maritalea mediterranea]MCF4098720.1 hypothetical protein [Maritalea mediterranea]
MRTLSLTFAALLSLFITANTALAQQFPNISAKDLNGRSVNLPADFNANRSLLFIAFEQEQQAQVNTWLPFAQQLENAGQAKFYELPVLPSALRLIGGAIENGMRSGIPSQATRAKTLTLYTNVTRFRKNLGLGGKNQIYAVVIDRQGRVLAVQSGAYSSAKANQIRAAL